MKQLWQYIKNPLEYCSYDFSVKAILLSALLCLIVPLLFKVLTVSVFVLAGVDLPAMTSDKSVLPLCFLIVVPPIVEELGFRLPLKRGRLNLCISVALIAFVFSKVIFAGGLYSEHLFCRIGFTIIASSIINLILGKWLQNVRFNIFFYSMAILFAMLHIVNYSHQTFGRITVVICYLLCLCQDSWLYIIWLRKNETRYILLHRYTHNQQSTFVNSVEK